jgi:mevalonate kinase
VIITGEHFVVHGALALAASLSQKTRVEASRASRLTVETALGRYHRAGSDLLPVERLVREMYRERGAEPKARVVISSELPAGAGLGSSASAMVATVVAVSRLEDWSLDTASIIETAMLGERLVHGNPSGIDVAVSAIGGVLQFRVGEEPTRLDLAKPVSLLVVYSGDRRSSKKLISKVSSMKLDYPHLFSKLCDSASLITELATERFLDGRLEELGRLMTYNHAVLGMVGASNERLDKLVDLCLESGCYGAKLTGAGGGGSVLGVAPAAATKEVVSRLAAKGFRSFISEAPSGGVKVWTTEQ